MTFSFTSTLGVDVDKVRDVNQAHLSPLAAASQRKSLCWAVKGDAVKSAGQMCRMGSQKPKDDSGAYFLVGYMAFLPGPMGRDAQLSSNLHKV